MFDSVYERIALYPTRSATWNLDRAKAPGIVDLKSPHIVNMGRLKIDDPRELSRRSKSKFMTELGIKSRVEPKRQAPGVQPLILNVTEH